MCIDDGISVWVGPWRAFKFSVWGPQNWVLWDFQAEGVIWHKFLLKLVSTLKLPIYLSHMGASYLRSPYQKCKLTNYVILSLGCTIKLQLHTRWMRKVNQLTPTSTMGNPLTAYLPDCVLSFCCKIPYNMDGGMTKGDMAEGDLPDWLAPMHLCTGLSILYIQLILDWEW